MSPVSFFHFCIFQWHQLQGELAVGKKKNKHRNTETHEHTHTYTHIYLAKDVKGRLCRVGTEFVSPQLF